MDPTKPLELVEDLTQIKGTFFKFSSLLATLFVWSHLTAFGISLGNELKQEAHVPRLMSGSEGEGG